MDRRMLNGFLTMQLPANLTMCASLPTESATFLTTFHYRLYCDTPAFKARLSYGAWRAHPETGYKGPRRSLLSWASRYKAAK